MSAATQQMVAWLKAAVTPCGTTKQGLCHTTEHQQVVVLFDNMPLRTGGVTPVTPVTPQKSNLLCACDQTTPSTAVTPAAGGNETTSNAPPPRPIPWFHLDADWRKAYAAWNAHRNTCPTCRISERTAATAGIGIKCDEGKRLHTAYEAALNNATGGYNP